MTDEVAHKQAEEADKVGTPTTFTCGTKLSETALPQYYCEYYRNSETQEWTVPHANTPTADCYCTDPPARFDSETHIYLYPCCPGSGQKHLSGLTGGHAAHRKGGCN